MEGTLTVRAKEAPVVLDVELLEVAQAKDNQYFAGLSATCEINRHDFGVSWNSPLEAGGFILGDKVKIEIDIEAFLEEPA